jgi:cell fate regulator YaaT (PSP1 superfamily)
VSRKEMLQYIENSGGRDYPFTTEGRVLRIATKEDLDEQARLEQSRHGLRLEGKAIAEELQLPMKIVDAEPLLGGERITFYFNAEERIDFRELVRLLGAKLRARVDMRQVGARDEARITADYERCGQHCCCKTFLKVLKPVSMRSAKVQKATLDPLKISGRCGRLMCCLRYEDQTYEELRKRLPKRKTRVGTPEGDGWVIDSQILTQLVLVQLEAVDKQVAVPVEDLTTPGPPRSIAPPPPPAAAAPRPMRGPQPRRAESEPRRPDAGRGHRPERPPTPPSEALESIDEEGPETELPPPGVTPTDSSESPPLGPDGQPRRRRRRRRRNKRPPGAEGGSPPSQP